MNAPTRFARRALTELRRRNIRHRSICASYALFSARKQQWIASNPAATPLEYDAAMNRIARECGV